MTDLMFQVVASMTASMVSYLVIRWSFQLWYNITDGIVIE